MMLSKPSESEAAAASNSETKVQPPAPLDAVADLERRLKDLSSATPHIPSAAAAAPTIQVPVAAVAPTATTNKNALLARIMAAQERAKQSQPVVSPPDFLDMAPTDAPPPPPSFDAFMGSTAAPAPPSLWNATPPPEPPSFDSMAPPSFDHMAPPSMPPPTQPAYMQWDPHATASAPAFEDLMDQAHHPPALLPPVPVPQAENEGLDDETLAMILGMEGLTAAEKQEMINEQLKILKSIEDSKKSSQMSAADAFEQRSLSTAVQGMGGRRMQMHGQERTPVQGGLDLTAEEAQQMADDAKLAEQLQNEEYEEADRANGANRGGDRSPSRTMGGVSSSPRSAAAPPAAPAATGSWTEWLGFGTPAPAPAPNAAIQSSASRDSDEGDGLLSGAATGRARVATTQPLFACVTDSIHSAANYAIHGVQEDEEGNVHGVDSSSLLAVTQVGRGSGNASNQRYEPLPDPS